MMEQQFTDESFQLAVHSILVTRPDYLRDQISLGVANQDTMERYVRLMNLLPMAQGQVGQLAYYASVIDADCLKLLSSLQPTTVSMQLNIRLCRAVQELAEIAKDLSVI